MEKGTQFCGLIQCCRVLFFSFLLSFVSISMECRKLTCCLINDLKRHIDSRAYLIKNNVQTGKIWIKSTVCHQFITWHPIKSYHVCMCWFLIGGSNVSHLAAGMDLTAVIYPIRFTFFSPKVIRIFFLSIRSISHLLLNEITYIVVCMCCVCCYFAGCQFMVYITV